MYVLLDLKMSLESPELPPSQRFSEAHLHARTYQKGIFSFETKG